jgi:hypothetical protein
MMTAGVESYALKGESMMTHDQRRISRRARFGLLGAAAALGAALALSVNSLAFAAGGARAAAPPAPVRPQSLTVTTDKGQVEGRTTGTVDQWLGIP